MCLKYEKNVNLLVAVDAFLYFIFKKTMQEWFNTRCNPFVLKNIYD